MDIRRLAVMALALTASAAVGADTTTFDTALLPASSVPYLELAALDANTANSFRMLVPTDEMSGLAQIRALVGHTDFEEQWAFVPAINLWIEVGISESASALDSQVEIDLEYLKRIVGLYHTVQIFHFHPAGFYRRVWQRDPFPIDFPADDVERDRVQPIGYALPSPTDVFSSIQLSEMLFAQDPQSRITYSVVSPHGLVTYGTTALGLTTVVYENGNPRNNVTQTIVTRIAIRRMEFNIASTIQALGSPTIGAVIEELCAQSSDAYYKLAYTPF